MVSPRDVISVAIGFEIGPTLGTTTLVLNDPVRGLLDTGQLGEDNSFVTVTDDVRSITIERGAQRVDSPVVRNEAGHGVVTLDNSSRAYDPENLNGPYVAAGVSQVIPTRPIVISGRYAGVDYRLITAYIDGWDLSWDGNTWAEVAAPFTDGFGVLAQTERVAVTPVGAGEDTGARVTRILDTTDWPSADRDIDVGDATLAETTLAGSALDELQIASDSEIGELYVNGSGVLVFRNRSAILNDARSTTVQATFGDGGSPELYYAHNGVKFSADRETLYNRIIAQRTDGAEIMVEDFTSQGTHLIKTWSKTDLALADDSQVSDYANFILQLSKDPENRFTELIVKPFRDPDTLFPKVLGLEIGDRIGIIRRFSVGDPTIRECFIRGIRHEIGISDWTTTFTLQSATKYIFFTLDDSIKGVLDQNALGF